MTTGEKRDKNTQLPGIAEHIERNHPAVNVRVYEDETDITPMVTFQADSGQLKAAVLRDLFRWERETEMRVEAVHDHQIVARG